MHHCTKYVAKYDGKYDGGSTSSGGGGGGGRGGGGGASVVLGKAVVAAEDVVAVKVTRRDVSWMGAASAEAHQREAALLMVGRCRLTHHQLDPAC